MAKRTDIKKILIIGAGPIMIGQGCEFDYSGTQACTALKNLGYEVILVNSNAATIMNDANLADRTYIEPLTTDFIEKIIIREKPCALLPTVGGQTALNLTVDLSKKGILDKYNVKLIGANLESINKAEDRALFGLAMKKIGLKVPYNVVVNSLEQGKQEIEKIGLPVIIRPSFTLGGTGGGIAYNIEEFEKMLSYGLQASPIGEVQLDQSILGFKEYELEVVCDEKGNFLVICSIENIDPMGIHTGDSITVAPAVTLTDKEYQAMRNAAKQILKEIGIQTGGANVQFAVNPKNGELFVVEMNPRVSRSSALASKATGYPIAKIAAMVAVGMTLDEIANDCTPGIPASFEPSIDYMVVKIPRFNFEKFTNFNPNCDIQSIAQAQELSTAMKSVGEVMALGRNFLQALQKAIISLEEDFDGIYSKEYKTNNFSSLQNKKNEILQQVSRPIHGRILKIADAFRAGATVQEILDLTQFDAWFVRYLLELVEYEKEIINCSTHSLTKEQLYKFKTKGFSDSRIAFLMNTTEEQIQNIRKQFDLHPVYKRVDTCAAEFDVKTNYLYSSYTGDIYNHQFTCEAKIPSQTKKQKIIILGSGCNRIGQGIEFDYSCVHAAQAIRQLGMEAIMINCNPETVSTDYQTSDKLYFEPIISEYVLEIINAELSNPESELLGVISQFGGQTGLKIVKNLANHPQFKLLGTSANSLDIAEDRKRFKDLIEQLELNQPNSLTANNQQELLEICGNQIHFPLMLRPSYVLGGRAMSIIYDQEQLKNYLTENPTIFDSGVVLIDEFLINATEMDVDAISDGNEVYICGIMEHIEEAGIHSGDSCCITPPPYLSQSILERVKQITIQLTKSLQIKGIINIQFAVQNNKIYIIEANPRASRTVPFISKITNIPFANIATQLICGKKLSELSLPTTDQIHHKYAAKMPVFPFLKFKDADCILGPEMRSTGEVMGIDTHFEAAFAKAFIAAHGFIPTTGNILISVRNADKNQQLIELSKILIKNNFTIYATKGTAEFLKQNNIETILTHKIDGSRPNLLDLIINNQINLYINTSDNSKAIKDGIQIRRTALMKKVPCIRNLAQAFTLAKAIDFSKNNEFTVYALQDNL